ncbi:hypothetical protein HQ590_06755 [bacterium]|nr:hypothetical protein [bacterium]
MKVRHHFGAIGVVCLAWLACAGPVLAGWLGPGQPDTSDQQLARIFGADRSFTATASMSVLDRKGKVVHAAELQYAVRDGRVRTEIDLTRMKADGKRAEGAAQMASFGMERIIQIVRPDKNLTWMVYPGLRGYCATPLSAGPAGTNAAPAITRTELGNETIDGHPCVKSKITILEPAGQQHEVLVWEATDLDRFPIQTQVQAGKDTMVTRFRDIKMDQPNANLFEVPPGYKEYRSIQEMMMSGMQQMIQGGGQ